MHEEEVEHDDLLGTLSDGREIRAEVNHFRRLAFQFMRCNCELTNDIDELGFGTPHDSTKNFVGRIAVCDGSGNRWICTKLVGQGEERYVGERAVFISKFLSRLKNMNGPIGVDCSRRKSFGDDARLSKFESKAEMQDGVKKPCELLLVSPALNHPVSRLT